MPLPIPHTVHVHSVQRPTEVPCEPLERLVKVVHKSDDKFPSDDFLGGIDVVGCERLHWFVREDAHQVVVTFIGLLWQK